MSVKLVSANLGIILTVEKDGKQETKQFSVICPSDSSPHPAFALNQMCSVFNNTFGTNFVAYDKSTYPKPIPIAKPKKIKAKRPVSQDEFNQRIKELQP